MLGNEDTMFRIKMADLMIEIHNHYDYVKKMCAGYLAEAETVDWAISRDISRRHFRLHTHALKSME